jgi:hypothetical protein
LSAYTLYRIDKRPPRAAVVFIAFASDTPERSGTGLKIAGEMIVISAGQSFVFISNL